jgi:hypothetical protein
VTETDLTEPLWRALAVYRFASLVYAVALVIYDRGDYSRLGWTWAALTVLVPSRPAGAGAAAPCAAPFLCAGPAAAAPTSTSASGCSPSDAT